MSYSSGDWSSGPQQRPKPAGGLIVTAVLGVVVIALLASGVVGLAIHHNSVKYHRIVDAADHLSLKVPASWRQHSISDKDFAASLADLKATNPSIGSLAERALATLNIGVFATDKAEKTAVVAFGGEAGALASVAALQLDKVVEVLNAIGTKNIHAIRTHLRIGDAAQVSIQSNSGPAFAEVADYVVVKNRLVVIIVAAIGNTVPIGRLHQIEASLAAA